MQPLKKFSSESIQAIARNPNINLQFQDLLTQMDTKQRQSIDQKLKKTCRNRRICRHLHTRIQWIF